MAAQCCFEAGSTPDRPPWCLSSNWNCRWECENWPGFFPFARNHSTSPHWCSDGSGFPNGDTKKNHIIESYPVLTSFRQAEGRRTFGFLLPAVWSIHPRFPGTQYDHIKLLDYAQTERQMPWSSLPCNLVVLCVPVVNVLSFGIYFQALARGNGSSSDRIVLSLSVKDIVLSAYIRYC